MKVYNNLVFTILLCLLTVVSVSAQQKTAGKSYLNVEVEKFTIQSGVEYPADKIDGLAKSIVDTLNRSNRFTQVSMSGDAAAASSDTTDRLKISGEITKYKKGSRAARYLVGFGAGSTKVVANIKFINAATGEVILQQSIDGDVWIGLFGGSSDDAKNGVADELIRVMKKNGLAGEKMKK